MFDLIAEGKQPNQRWRKKIRDFDWHMIGRQPGPYCVDWDSQLSRQHVQFRQVPDGIEVERFPNSTNPVFFDGHKADFFKIKANQHFVIGQTRFGLVNSESEATQDVPSPIQQQTFSDQFLNALDYRDANLRINVLSQLPELIADAANEEQLLDRITNVLLQGVPQAEVVAIVSTTSPKDPVTIKHWDSRHELEESFKPSETLIRQAIGSQETVLHVWSDRGGAGSNYTIQQHADWAYVCPLKATACRGQAVYVSGKVGRIGATLTTELLHDDLKFTQLVTSTYANVIELESLQRRQAALRTFFSPIVVEALAGRDPDQVLEPRACYLSVL
ncbi:MAG: FHA domain-containing protein, partial [Pirellulaceae bacterium]